MLGQNLGSELESAEDKKYWTNPRLGGIDMGLSYVSPFKGME